MPTLTLLSNGHGEDAIGALLATELRRQRPELTLQAFPVVGDGAPYRSVGVQRRGPQRSMPSGGLTLHSWPYLRADLRAGLLGMTAEQLRALRRLRTDLLLVVGDVYAQALSALVRARVRFVLQPLVSQWASRGARSTPNRFFMEHISYPERLLMRHLARRVYVRDALTEETLRARGLEHVRALGNPVLDALDGTPIEGLEALDGDAPARARVALLPGTRAHTPAALRLMLAALAQRRRWLGLVAWAGATLPLQAFAADGWSVQQHEPPLRGRLVTLRRDGQCVLLFGGRFADVLASADAVLGTAGTANEQAAALGLPVVSFPLPPHYTEAFVRNQKRLLGDALLPSRAEPGRLAADLERALHDPRVRRAARRAARERMGAPGGSRAVVADLLAEAVNAGVLPPPL